MFDTYLTGDVHGDFISRFSFRRNPWLRQLDGHDIVFVLGDCGVPWGTSAPWYRKECMRRDRNQLEFLQSKPWTTICVTGNHDDYDFIRCLPRVNNPYGSGIVRQMMLDGDVYSHVLVIDETQAMSFNDRKVLVIPGARSHDVWNGIVDYDPDTWTKRQLHDAIRARRRQSKYGWRVRHVNWWPEEDVDVQPALDLIGTGASFDLILSHDPPAKFIRDCRDTLSFRPNEREEQLDDVRKMVPHRAWYCGHQHLDETIPDGDDGLVGCLFEDIIKVE